MSIAHSFMRIHIHRACFMSIARYEHSSYFGPMYEHSSYYDNGFIIDELMLYLIMLSCFHDPYRKAQMMRRPGTLRLKKFGPKKCY